VNRLRPAIQLWLLSFAICAAIVVVSFHRIDLPLALYCSRFFQRLAVLGGGLGSAIILSGEAATTMALIIVRLVWGKLPHYAEALALACLVSICAHAIDSDVLKLFFGVPNPTDVAQGAHHGFNLWKGSPQSSFPSGHMALASAFAGVFMRLYRISVWPLSILLFIASALLVAGGWHFFSDVVAGTFLGVSAGLLAGELWVVHSARPA
jgi:membrane-associated phospholipid phosphatase